MMDIGSINVALLEWQIEARDGVLIVTNLTLGNLQLS